MIRAIGAPKRYLPYVRVVIAIMLLLMGCDDRAPGETAARPAATVQVELNRESATSFDLVAAGDGALLVWTAGRGIFARHYDAHGAAGAKRVAVARTQVVELAAAVSGDAAAVVWVGDGRVRSAMGDRHTLMFGDAIEAGPTSAIAGRGHVAVAAEPLHGTLTAFVRGVDEPCPGDRSEQCATFSIVDVPPAGSASTRPMLAVPEPCAYALSGFAIIGDHVHYAVCSGDTTREMSTIFTARQHPEYAQAQKRLEGCTPTGHAVLGDAMWLTAQCGTSHAGVSVRGIYVSPKKIDLATTDIVCHGGHPSVKVSNSLVDTTQLKAGADRFGALLPRDVAPRFARAVWTGQTLLIASTRNGRLEVSRHICKDDALLRL